MIKSKLTAKAQTTIPQPVRDALGLQEGDEIAYAIRGDSVIIRKMRRQPVKDDPFATFTEWDGEADREAYAKL